MREREDFVSFLSVLTSVHCCGAEPVLSAAGAALTTQVPGQEMEIFLPALQEKLWHDCAVALLAGSSASLQEECPFSAHSWRGLVREVGFPVFKRTWSIRDFKMCCQSLSVTLSAQAIWFFSCCLLAWFCHGFLLITCAAWQQWRVLVLQA